MQVVEINHCGVQGIRVTTGALNITYDYDKQQRMVIFPFKKVMKLCIPKHLNLSYEISSFQMSV